MWFSVHGPCIPKLKVYKHVNLSYLTSTKKERKKEILSKVSFKGDTVL